MQSSDLDRVARQLATETQAQEEQRHRLATRVNRAEERRYASSTIYGQKLLKQTVGPVADTMTERLHLLRRGSAAIDGATVYERLKSADPDRLALITMKVTLDVLGKDAKPELCALTLPIGNAIQTDLRLEYYFERDPDLYGLLHKSFHGSTGTRQKETVYKYRFNKAGIKWDTWSNDVVHKIGTWAFNCMVSKTGFCRVEHTVVGKKKAANIVRFTPRFLDLKEKILSLADDLAFCQWPMVCDPLPWSNDESGGYLTGHIRDNMPLVRAARHPLGPVKQGHVPIDMLNRLQRVKYKINSPVLAVANYCFDNFITVGKCRRDNAIDIPPRPGDQASEDQVKDYKRLVRSIHDSNAQLEQKNWRTTETLFVANKFSEEEWFTHVWSADYRGRLYPLSGTSLSIQGTEFERSLHYFYEEGPVNAWWLAWTVATTRGLDKASMEERVQWTEDNEELIALIASDPIEHLDLWKDADEPWSHLGAVLEYDACVLKGTKRTSGLCCGIDATQSGIQHMSALTFCADAGAKVNLLPSDKPCDGYRLVAERALDFIDDKEVHPYIDRKVAKRPTMVLPYSGTRESSRGYIREALRDKGLDLTVPKRLSLITTAIYDKAIPEIYPGPVEVMNWFKRSARDILEKREFIQWTSPSGFVVRQDLRKSECKRIKTRIMGEMVRTTIGTSWGDPDVNHHVNALSPNVIHSNDSALIHLTFVEWDKPFSVIHDCVLGRSCDMTQMSREIRTHFVEMYKAPVLEQWAEEVGVKVPDGLVKGTLDIDLVNHSTYFFC